MTERRALWLAGMAHLLLVAALSLALRDWQPQMAEAEVTPIAFIAVGAETRSPEPAAPAPAPTPLPDPVPETVVAAAEPQAPPPPAEAATVPDTAPADAVALEPAPRPPRPSAAPRPPAPAFDAGALEALIDRSVRKPAQRAPDGREAAATGKAPGRPDPRALATLEAAIRAQIAPCWNPPAGGADVREMTVVLRIRLNRDGSVASPPELVSQTGATEANAAYARAFVETARRAVLRCAPLDLPGELYAEWRSFELNFDPRMLT